MKEGQWNVIFESGRMNSMCVCKEQKKCILYDRNQYAHKRPYSQRALDRKSSHAQFMPRARKKNGSQVVARNLEISQAVGRLVGYQLTNPLFLVKVESHVRSPEVKL